jgi:hypothetical protein
MIQSNLDALEEMTALKTAIQIQNKAFMQNLQEINTNLVNDTVELRDKQNEVLSFISQMKLKAQDQQGHIDQLFSRMENAEKRLIALDNAQEELSRVKCNNAEFQDNLARINQSLYKNEVSV